MIAFRPPCDASCLVQGEFRHIRISSNAGIIMEFSFVGKFRHQPVAIARLFCDKQTHAPQQLAASFNPSSGE
jgi:hypothetical protein